VSGPPSLRLAAARVFPDIKGPFSLSRRLEGLETDAIGQAKENGQGLTPLPANVRRAGWASERSRTQGGLREAAQLENTVPRF